MNTYRTYTYSNIYRIISTHTEQCTTLLPARERGKTHRGKSYPRGGSNPRPQHRCENVSTHWTFTPYLRPFLQRIYTHFYTVSTPIYTSTTSGGILHQIGPVLSPIIAPVRKSFLCGIAILKTMAILYFHSAVVHFLC